MTGKHISLVFTLAVILGALTWIAGINLIDATFMVAGRVTDRTGRPLKNLVARLEIANRTYEQETNDLGCFVIRTMTGPLGHESRFVIFDRTKGFESPVVR